MFIYNDKISKFRPFGGLRRRVIKTIEVKMIYMVGKHAEDEHR
jgi:hypothetical protein